MKKIAFAMAIMAFAGFASAQDQQGTNSNSSSTAVSKSQGGAGGAGGTSTVSGVNASNGLTVGCLVNCANTDQGSKDLADSAVQAALINADAAKTVAATNGQTARDVAGTTAVIKNTPSVSGPALSSSNDTCMGSSSGSANVPGIGIGFGTSWVDTNCKMLKNARELWNMGMKGAAMALMCKDPDNREALELTGYICPTKKEQRVSEAASNEQYTDPIVRARLGLPALASAK